MKITKRQLRQIIKEESAKLAEQGGINMFDPREFADRTQQLIGIIAQLNEQAPMRSTAVRDALAQLNDAALELQDAFKRETSAMDKFGD